MFPKDYVMGTLHSVGDRFIVINLKPYEMLKAT